MAIHSKWPSTRNNHPLEITIRSKWPSTRNDHPLGITIHSKWPSTRNSLSFQNSLPFGITTHLEYSQAQSRRTLAIAHRSKPNLVSGATSWKNNNSDTTLPPTEMHRNHCLVLMLRNKWQSLSVFGLRWFHPCLVFIDTFGFKRIQRIT